VGPKQAVTFTRLQIGNRHRPAVSSSASSSSDSVHEWTVFVRTEEARDANDIERVTFELHKSFELNIVEVHSWPFELTRLGWGTFEVRIRVRLSRARTKDASLRERVFVWPLQFDEAERYDSHLMYHSLPSRDRSHRVRQHQHKEQEEQQGAEEELSAQEEEEVEPWLWIMEPPSDIHMLQHTRSRVQRCGGLHETLRLTGQSSDR